MTLTNTGKIMACERAFSRELPIRAGEVSGCKDGRKTKHIFATDGVPMDADEKKRR
jgi:hypothetical protein